MKNVFVMAVFFYFYSELIRREEMEYTDLIRQRESVRNYDPGKPVDIEVLKKILDAGRLAPSACNIQPWKFLVISSPALLQKVKDSYPRPWFKDAPHVLVIVGDRDKAWKRSFDGYNSIETDMTIAMSHIILAAENEGVSTCWIEAYDPAILRHALKLEDNQVVFGITPLGYPKPGYVRSQDKNRKTLDEIAEFI
jgi:nitroreductase